MRATVNSGPLKNAFKMISSLMKATELTRSIGITTENNKLYITFRATIIYQEELTIISSQEYVNTSISVRYVNLDKLLSGMKTTDIEINSFGVTLINPAILAPATRSSPRP